jgi:hypothetical protein
LREIVIDIAFYEHRCYPYHPHHPNVMQQALNSGNDLSQYTRSIFLPYTHGFSSQDVPRIKTTIGGVQLRLPMDTGSTGILIGTQQLPDIGPHEGIPAHHFFTSSKILYQGRLVDLRVTFHGVGDGNATATVPVLVVDKSVVCPWYDPKIDTFACPHDPNKPSPELRDTSKIAYMGIGFGRNSHGDGQPFAIPKANPFLNIDTINGEALRPGAIRAGYIISTKGVHLGLTEQTTQGFAYTELERGVTHEEDPRDWAMVKMCFSINGRGSNCGPALIDTGIPQMYLRTEEGVDIPEIAIRVPDKDGHAKTVKRVKPGTKITVGFPLLGTHVAEYSFTIGEGGIMEPIYGVPEKQRSPPFINTGRNFLLGFSIAFDAIGGRLGFRPVEPPHI